MGRRTPDDVLLADLAAGAADLAPPAAVDAGLHEHLLRQDRLHAAVGLPGRLELDAGAGAAQRGREGEAVDAVVLRPPEGEQRAAVGPGRRRRGAPRRRRHGDRRRRRELRHVARRQGGVGRPVVGRALGRALPGRDGSGGGRRDESRGQDHRRCCEGGGQATCVHGWLLCGRWADGSSLPAGRVDKRRARPRLRAGRSQQAAAPGHRGGLGARRGLELGQDVGDVDRHGLGADEELLADLAVGATLGDEGEDLPLPRCERRPPGCRSRARARTPGRSARRASAGRRARGRPRRARSATVRAPAASPTARSTPASRTRVCATSGTLP